MPVLLLWVRWEVVAGLAGSCLAMVVLVALSPGEIPVLPPQPRCPR